MQVAIQKYIDNSISKTINLPENYNDLSDEDFASFSDFALESSKELKGLTIYRAGSKGNEPLRAIPTTSENIEKHLGLAVSENATADSCSLDGGDCG